MLIGCARIEAAGAAPNIPAMVHRMTTATARQPLAAEFAEGAPHGAIGAGGYGIDAVAPRGKSPAIAIRGGMRGRCEGPPPDTKVASDPVAPSCFP